MLKIIVIFVLLYLVFRYMLRPSKPVSGRNSGRKAPLLLADKIVPCPTCGVYNPTQIAFVSKGNYFCNEDCFKKQK